MLSQLSKAHRAEEHRRTILRRAYSLILSWPIKEADLQAQTPGDEIVMPADLPVQAMANVDNLSKTTAITA